MEIFRLIQGPLENNVFIIKNNNKSILIDPGLDKDKIEKWIDTINVKPEAILVTHGHFDHIASVKYFQNKFNCSVHFGAEDKFLLNNPYGPLSMNKDSFGKIDADFTFKKTTEKEFEIAGMKIQIIKTPGHTPGSTCYFFPELNVVFTGDTLFKNTIGRTDFQKGCIHTITKSIKQKLYTLPEKTIIWPGHGESSIIKNEKNNNIYVKEGTNE